ncbi:PAS domain-containing protein [candidate division WOR-3 bacterium]|nr:PAS domain-containing protein [candidate division WOR-3 bacterium]
MHELKTSILIISQDLELIDLTTRVLENEGYEVTTCSKPKQVISHVRSQSFDVVFIDAHMRDAPYEKVIEVVRRVTRDAEMVLITSYAFPEVSKHDTIDVGSYLVQPLTDDKIRNAVVRALHQVKLSRENRRLLSTVTKAKKQWEATVDAIDDPIFLTDFEHNILRANLSTYRRLDKGVDEVLGHKCYEIFHCAENILEDCPGKRAMNTGEMVSDIIPFKGLKQKLSCDVYPQVFSGGGLVHHLHAPTVSFETQAEMMTTYERVFDESVVPILLLDVEDFKVVDANRRALEFFAREPERIFNIDLENLFTAAESESAVSNIIAQLENPGGSYRTQILDGRGKEKDAYIVANNVDVRSRRLAEIFVIPIDLL